VALSTPRDLDDQPEEVMSTNATKQIAFVLYPGLTPLDLIGPLQTLAPLPRIDPTFEVLVVGEHTDFVTTDAVVKLAPSHTFDDAPTPPSSTRCDRSGAAHSPTCSPPILISHGTPDSAQRLSHA
jgi:hypothetical protein